MGSSFFKKNEAKNLASYQATLARGALCCSLKHAL
jgi:hypothetical protein